MKTRIERIRYIQLWNMERDYKVPTKIQTAFQALGQYSNAIQYCTFACKENDYQPLINELKQFSAGYNQQLKARAIRRKKGEQILEESSIELPKI